jgi:hypothetical protein
VFEKNPKGGVMINFWSENRTKILGSFIAVVTAITMMVSGGTFEGLMSDAAVRWLEILCQLVVAGAGVWTAGVGLSNTTRERVAASAATAEMAKASAATSMETALHTPVPTGGRQP